MIITQEYCKKDKGVGARRLLELFIGGVLSLEVLLISIKKSGI